MEFLAICLGLYAVFVAVRASDARTALEQHLQRLQGELALLRVRLEILEGSKATPKPAPGERGIAPPPPAAPPPEAESRPEARQDRQPPPHPQSLPQRPESAPASAQPGPAAPVPLPRRAPGPEPARRDWSDWLPGWAQRLMGANTLVRTGVLVLFFGVAFLLKWVTERVTFPIEARLAAAALGGLALAVVGWRLRRTRRGYGLSLQGGGIGIFYISIYAAAKIYHLLPPVVALALMLGVVALAAALAIAQDALALAMLGAAGGFLAPVLTSTGEGDYRLLLGYYVLLNLGILALAFVKTWRPLNLLGFVFTFGFLALGLPQYFRYEHFWGTAPFVWMLFAMYVGVAILYARHRSLALKHYVDGTLVFGTPLAVGLLHQRLLDGAGDALAAAAAAFGLVYLALAWLVSRRRIVPSMGLLGEAFLAIGVVFVTLAVPLYFGGRATSALWALEGAAIVWISIRQRRLLGQAFGGLLQLLAGVSFLGAFLQGAGAWATSSAASPARPLLNTDFLGFLLLALAGFFVARQLLRSHWPAASRFGSQLAFWWALAWSIGGVANEIDGFVPDRLQLATALGAAALGALALMLARRRLQWPVALQPVFLLLPLLVVATVLGAIQGHPFGDGGYLAWPLALVAQFLFVASLDREPGPLHRAAPALHAVTYLFVVALAQVEAHWIGKHLLQLSNETLAALYLGLLAVALLAVPFALRLRAWPFRVHPATYLLVAGGLLAVAMTFALCGINLAYDGTAWQGVYAPLLNPVDFASIAALASLAVWQVAVWRHGIDVPYGRREAYVVFGVVAFFVANCVLLRALHHWTGTPYGDGMLRSTLVQTALTVFWTVLSVLGMVVATRTRRRLLWLIGAGLLGVVVVKLFLFDLATLQGLQRIVAFLVVGLLLLAIGYFSPVPPRDGDEARESPA